MPTETILGASLFQASQWGLQVEIPRGAGDMVTVKWPHEDEVIVGDSLTGMRLWGSRSDVFGKAEYLDL